jgi:hypothetical protein
MNSYRKILVSLFIACFATVAAFAADVSPAGVWKWTIQGRQGGQGFEQKLTLDFKDGKLTGTLHGRQTEQFTVPDVAISEASFKDGQIKFAATREINGNSFTTKYEGKLEGDTIKGTFERPGFGGGDPTKAEWNAQRQK